MVRSDAVGYMGGILCDLAPPHKARWLAGSYPHRTSRTQVKAAYPSGAKASAPRKINSFLIPSLKPRSARLCFFRKGVNCPERGFFKLGEFYLVEFIECFYERFGHVNCLTFGFTKLETLLNLRDEFMLN